MSLSMIGMNHKNAPVELRERFNSNCVSGFPGADGSDLEAVSVFTCNRFELYFYDRNRFSRKVFHNWLNKIAVSNPVYSECFYEKAGLEAVKHLFRVVSGLDSMVLGESQIMSQIKTSYQAAINAGCVGKNLHSLFRRALEVGKRVRRETELSKYSISVASTAVDLAQKSLGDLGELTAMIIGAGEMACQVARQLKSREIGRIIFTNRTFERARELAEKYAGHAVDFQNFRQKLHESDLVISSTGAPNIILDSSDFVQALNGRFNKPVMAIDIAVPRDISPDCRSLENFFLYDIDDLKNVVDSHFSQRKFEAEKAEAIISYEIEAFRFMTESANAGPLISLIKERTENLRKAELEKFISENHDLMPETLAKIDSLTKSLAAKCLHEPISFLKEGIGSHQAERKPL
ncbi:MAG: glutamyl-tRNA reductase [Candidatus Riflebacteria bacterium]|nr:glutamyl-tRNA reductase [Candidatus Riflebacteria bacterium]